MNQLTSAAAACAAVAAEASGGAGAARGGGLGGGVVRGGLGGGRGRGGGGARVVPGVPAGGAVVTEPGGEGGGSGGERGGGGEATGLRIVPGAGGATSKVLDTAYHTVSDCTTKPVSVTEETPAAGVNVNVTEDFSDASVWPKPQEANATPIDGVASRPTVRLGLSAR